MSTGLSVLSLDGVIQTRVPTCFRQHPLRSPSWCWERAVGISNQLQPASTRRLDGATAHGWIRKAVRFWQQYRNMRTAADSARLAEKYYEVYWAHWLYESQPDLRAQIEAYVLARVGPQGIAAITGMSLGVIEAYEALFFDVREHLNRELYILNAVFGPRIYKQLTDNDYQTLWRLYAYYTGPHVLRVLISRFSPNSWCDTPDQVSVGTRDDLITQIRLKANLAAKTIGVNRNTQSILLNAFIAYSEVEQAGGDGDKSQGLLMAGLESIWASLQVNINGRNPLNGGAAMDTGVAGQYDTGSVELRADELLAAGLGKPPDTLKLTGQFPALG